MKKKSIITMMLALVAMTGLAQTKTAIVTGYSPALKDGTVAKITVGPLPAFPTAIDTVKNGHFSFTLPIEKLTVGSLIVTGEGCPNYLATIWLSPDVTVKIMGTDCFFPLWKVESPLPEQQTQNRITEYTREAVSEYIEHDYDAASWEEVEPFYLRLMKQEIDILPTLPTDAASIYKLWWLSAMTAKTVRNCPYIEQLRELEKFITAHAPKGFEGQLAEIHTFLKGTKPLKVGEKAIDAELFDMQGRKHHLFDVMKQHNQYVLLDFWSLGCGPCLSSEPEMRMAYEKIQGKLEIIGINQNKVSDWRKNEFSKRIVWKNWNDGKKGNGGIESRYCDMIAYPYYVLLSPDGRILWKNTGYGVGWFMGMAEAISGPRQDNTVNIQFAIRKVNADANGTTISFRYYGHKNYWFRIAQKSYLKANDKKYFLTHADGIKLNGENYPQVKAFVTTDDNLANLYYTDFTLTFEPFDTIPTTFDFIEDNIKIRNVSIK